MIFRSSRAKWVLYTATALSSFSLPVMELIASDQVAQERPVSPFSNISEWTHLEHIDGSGGGTGVHVYQDPRSLRKYTVKDATHTNHLIEELTAKALYRAAGFNAPEFFVLDRTASFWPKSWNARFPDTPRLLISQYIEAGPNDEGKNKEKIQRWIDVLLGNFDLAGHNYIVDEQDEIYPIDFGGSLRLRACGELKLHEQLWGYFWPKTADCEAPSAEEIARFRANLPRMFATLMDLHHQISIPDFPSLWNILASRFHSFLNVFDPKPAHFFADRPAVEGKMAGGILFVTEVEGVPCTLLAKRHCGKWGDLGGGSKVSDRTINRTAWREAVEEMGGFIPVDYMDLMSSPYLEHEGDVHYRMFVHKVPSIDLTRLMEHVKSKDNPYAVEHTEFELVPLEALADDQRLYAPMRDLLATPHAREILKYASQGLKWTREKAGTPFNGRARLGDYIFDTLKLDLLDERTFRAKAGAARQLRATFKPKANSAAAVPVTQRYTQTQGCIKSHLGDTYIEGDDDANLSALILSKSSYFRGKPDLVAEKLPFIRKIVGLESQHPNHLVYYHGSLGHYGLLWTVATILRDELFLEEGTPIRSLRLYENTFDGIETCRQHLEGLGEDNDYAPGGQARMLSTNMSIVGSIGRSTSETLRYFFSNDCMSTPDQPQLILRKYLEVVLQLPQIAVDQLMRELAPHFSSLEKVGVLFQLFAPQDLAEQFTYLSQPGGHRVLFKGQKVPDLNSSVGFIKMLKETPEEIQGFVESDDWINFQGRVMVHPELLYGEQSHNVHTQVYFSDEKSVADLVQVVRRAVGKFIAPHIHLAQSHQAYTTPPRQVQLHKLITGAAHEEVDPRLQELLDLSQDWVKNADEIMLKLQNQEVARLVKMDALTLKRVRAIELSPMLAPLADALSKKLPGMTATEWVAELEAVKDKYQRTLSFVEQKGLKTDRQGTADMAKLLAVEPDDPEFARLRHILDCPYTNMLLRYSPPQNGGDIKDQLGAIVERLHGWGKRRGCMLRWLHEAGFLEYNSSASPSQGAVNYGINNNTAIMFIEASIETGQLRKILKMFVKEKFPFERGAMNFIPWSALINDVAKKGVEESRTLLREIVTDLQITEPISFGEVDELMDTKATLGNAWKGCCEQYIRILKPYATDPVSALDLLDEYGPEKVEQVVNMLVREGYLRTKADASNANVVSTLPGGMGLQAIYSLCSIPNPEEVFGRFTALFSVNGANRNIIDFIHTNLFNPTALTVLERFRDSILVPSKITLEFNNNTCNTLSSISAFLISLSNEEMDRVMGLLASASLDPSTTLEEIMGLLQVLMIDKDSWQDAEPLPIVIANSLNPQNWTQASYWAKEKDATKKEAAKLLIKAGYYGLYGDFDKTLQVVADHVDFIKEHPEVILPFEIDEDKYSERLVAIIRNYPLIQPHWDMVTSSDYGGEFVEFIVKNSPSVESIEALASYCRANPNTVLLRHMKTIPIEFELLYKFLVGINKADALEDYWFFDYLFEFHQKIETAPSCQELTKEHKEELIRVVLSLSKHIPKDPSYIIWRDVFASAGLVVQHDPTSLKVVLETADRYVNSSKEYFYDTPFGCMYASGDQRRASSIRAFSFLNRYPGLEFDVWRRCYQLMHGMRNPELFEPILMEYFIPLQQSGMILDDVGSMSQEFSYLWYCCILGADAQFNDEERSAFLSDIAQVREELDKMNLIGFKERFQVFQEEIRKLMSSSRILKK